MALKSMTGFGRGSAASGGVAVEAEVSSVNRKQLDVRIALPRNLVVLESRVQELVRSTISRGHVTGSVKVSLSDAARSRCVEVDVETARAYVKRLRLMARELKLDDDLGVGLVARLPEVVQLDTVSVDTEKTWRLIRRALKAALTDLLSMRVTEGATLEKDLRRRLKHLRTVRGQIGRAAPRVSKRYRENVLKRLEGAGLSLSVDDPSVLREVALFAERCDISEELVRLSSHMDQVEEHLGSRKPVGRALDFLCQEMFREINTIGSKASDASISKHVVSFKASLESVREQVQNIE